MILREPAFTVDRDKGGYFRLSSAMAWGWAAMLVVVDIPAGFSTDFASVPRALRALFPVNGKHRLSAVLHDYLYRQGGHLVVDSAFHEGRAVALFKRQTIRYTRKDADQAFYLDMLAAGVNPAKAWAMYRGVRAFGWLFWNKCQKCIGEKHG